MNKLSEACTREEEDYFKINESLKKIATKYCDYYLQRSFFLDINLSPPALKQNVFEEEIIKTKKSILKYEVTYSESMMAFIQYIHDELDTIKKSRSEDDIELLYDWIIPECLTEYCDLHKSIIVNELGKVIHCINILDIHNNNDPAGLPGLCSLIRMLALFEHLVWLHVDIEPEHNESELSYKKRSPQFKKSYRWLGNENDLNKLVQKITFLKKGENTNLLHIFSNQDLDTIQPAKWK